MFLGRLLLGPLVSILPASWEKFLDVKISFLQI